MPKHPPAKKRIRRLFIANRGECACRIIRTAKKLGIHCIAAQAKDDYGLHSEIADDVALIKSYLDAADIVRAAKQYRADAIHPGWGFLSEQATFAELTERAGMHFVGPPPAAMRKAANKVTARQCAQQLNIPVAVGAKGTPATLRAAAHRMGYPVMIKAAVGGGGRGMRIAKSDADFSDAITAAALEAKTAFADSSLLVEKYIPQARHIEAQLLCDNNGAVQVLGLRDCSVQRRRQKIVEEAPPPKLSPALKQQLHDAAVLLAQSLNYRNAGTVEFLVAGNAYFFLEINARLQVEHPLTEITCGLDLVEWQLRIAAGENLPAPPQVTSKISQQTSKQHAIEARLCAENPLNDFLPAVGALRCVLPQLENVRVDSGLYDGGRENIIGGGYDSMLAKIIAYGKTREEARQLLQLALSQTWLSGIANNAAFLRHILATPNFIDSKMHTGWIDKNAASIVAQLNQQRQHAACLTAIWRMQQTTEFAAIGLRLFEQPQTRMRFYEGAAKLDKLDITVIMKNNDNYEVHIHDKNNTRIAINNVRFMPPTTARALGATAQLQAEIDGVTATIQYAPQHKGVEVFYDGLCLRFQFFAPPQNQKTNNQTSSEARAPMQAVVRKSSARAKQKVKSGDVLFLLESMKMEIPIIAPRDGIIEKVLCAVGDTVPQGALLASLVDDFKSKKSGIIKNADKRSVKSSIKPAVKPSAKRAIKRTKKS